MKKENCVVGAKANYYWSIADVFRKEVVTILETPKDNGAVLVRNECNQFFTPHYHQLVDPEGDAAEMRDLEKRRIKEIKYQWEVYKKVRWSLDAEELARLKEDAKKLGVLLK